MLKVSSFYNGIARLSEKVLNEYTNVTHSISLKVTDSSESSVVQNFDLKVLNTNNSPTIKSTPVVIAYENQEYKYILDVDDLDFNTLNPDEFLSLNIVSTPNWMNVTKNNLGDFVFYMDFQLPRMPRKCFLLL